MNRFAVPAFAVSLAVLPAPVHAAPREIVQPIQLGDESVRFDHGAFIIDATGQKGAVQIRPEASDHGSLSFSLAVFNGGTLPVNIDVSSIRIEGTSEPVRVLTHHEMVQKAENRAGWKKALTIIGGGLVAGSLANQRNHYSATTFGPYGRTYYTTIDAPCGSCQVAAVATMAATGYRLDRIQNGLDATRRALGDEMLQMTTLDPGTSYAGRIFLTRFKRKPMSEMRLIVRINDEDHVFGFRFAKPGTPPPAYRMAAVRVVPASVPLPASAPIREARLQPIASPTATEPVVMSLPQMAVSPARAAPAASHDARSDSWRRYYSGLRDSGMNDAKARAQADRVIGVTP